MTTTAAMDPSTRHLWGRLAVVEARVQVAVARRRVDDPDPADRFRGLYISDAEVDRFLSGSRLSLVPEPPDPETAQLFCAVEASADADEVAGADLRLRRLSAAFGLDVYDLELMLMALAPDVDARFERLYGYLNDDVSQRRVSVGLALELSGASGIPGAAVRSRLGPAGPLLRGSLLVVEDQDRPFLTRPLRVPDRVTAFLLGDDAHDSLVADLLVPVTSADLPATASLARALRAGARLVYVRQAAGGAGLALGAAAIEMVTGTALALDLDRLGRGGDIADLAGRAAREARLCAAGVVAGPVEAIAERGPDAVRVLAEAPTPTLILLGATGWDPRWSAVVPLIMEAPIPSIEDRTALWARALNGGGPTGGPNSNTVHFRLAPEQISRAAEAARLHAAAAGRDVDDDDIRIGARAQNAAGLERLARRVEPRVGWDDLVLPAAVVTQLRELVARVRQRDVVFEQWQMGHKSSKGRGIKALFAGDSGTGKTLSAEVAAGELGLDLYVIDLSTVVDKYVGETEKNLDRIFAEADRVNGVLLFDEADALFGKRSEVKDAQDRYANVEVAYLLQRMEMFEGLAILTTNLRGNLDDAFARRLDAIVDFAMPEEDDRRRLWELNLTPAVPQDDDIRPDFLAAAFRLSGGNIRNIVLGAAFLAADQRRAVGMADLIRATGREYGKLGHMCAESEFGPYFDLVRAPAR